MGVFGCFSETGSSKSSSVEFQRLSKLGEADEGESDGEVLWREMEVAESKQLSPVSVLELHSDEGSPIHSHNEDEKPSTSGSSPKQAFGAPRQGLEELLIGSTSPALIDRNAEGDEEPDRSGRVAPEVGKSTSDPQEYRSSPQIAEKLIEDQLFSWEQMRADFVKIPDLIDSDFSKSAGQWSQFHPEMREIGKEIENLIFEEIRRECALDMLNYPCTFETCSVN